MNDFATPIDDRWFEGLIASGWDTVSLFMRMFADHYLSKAASLASPASTSCAGRPRSDRATRCGRG